MKTLLALGLVTLLLPLTAQAADPAVITKPQTATSAPTAPVAPAAPATAQKPAAAQAATPASAQKSATPPATPQQLASMSQQDKMRECNKQATGKKGDERKAFMKNCLSRKPV